jgi:hypothetical protein
LFARSSTAAAICTKTTGLRNNKASEGDKSSRRCSLLTSVARGALATAVSPLWAARKSWRELGLAAWRALIAWRLQLPACDCPRSPCHAPAPPCEAPGGPSRARPPCAASSAAAQPQQTHAGRLPHSQQRCGAQAGLLQDSKRGRCQFKNALVLTTAVGAELVGAAAAASGKARCVESTSLTRSQARSRRHCLKPRD